MSDKRFTRCPIVGRKDESCEIAVEFPTGKLAIYQLPEDVYHAVVTQGFVEVAVPIQ